MRLPGESAEAWRARANSIAERLSDQGLKEFQQDILAGDESALNLATAVGGLSESRKDILTGNETGLELQLPAEEELSGIFNGEESAETSPELKAGAQAVLAAYKDFEERLAAGDPRAIIELAEAFEIGKIVDSLPRDPFVE